MKENKFTGGLVRAHREEQAEERRQELLKEKYDIREDVVVVEKSNTFISTSATRLAAIIST
ncbi:MAG TPA: hypothetical protein DEQ02_00865 [Ruminococcaceae bacterium]|nr:hypothetical protein [Oscillospiraceae bacterium]